MRAAGRLKDPRAAALPKTDPEVAMLGRHTVENQTSTDTLLAERLRRAAREGQSGRILAWLPPDRSWAAPRRSLDRAEALLEETRIPGDAY